MLVCLAVASILSTLSVLIWLAIYFHPARPWSFRPVGEDEPAPPDPATWPPVCVLVPARNEAELLPRTLPPLLHQDYPGSCRVILVDDRSSDGTAEAARRQAEPEHTGERLTVVTGASLPPGWVGKVWALEQGEAASREAPAPKAEYFLLTDADILHAPGSLRRLVAESEAYGWALNSRMARLRCESPAERLLVPAFVFFFNLLYPMRQVNDPRERAAAAAGGCVLLRRTALEQAGGFACIRDRSIDDVSLAQQVKRLGLPIHLALSRADVTSLRAYPTVSAIWRMVSRSAFTQLHHSWLLLAGTLFGLGVMFLLPPLLVTGTLAALAALLAAGPGATGAGLTPWLVILALKGILAWTVQAAVYRPALRFFGVPPARAWTLPLAGALYGAMTADSALRQGTGRAAEWRAESQPAR